MNDKTPFQVDEIVVMHSTFTDEDLLVNFRGRSGDKAVVIPVIFAKYPPLTQLQMYVPIEWLRKQEVK